MAENVGLHIEDFGGSGRPVVLIHGWPLSGEAWEKQIPALTGAGFRPITYDRRGFGQSDKPSDGFDYDTLAADLSAILDQKDLKNVTLVGFSMGGGEVARYIPKFGQDRLHSIVFAAAIPPYLMKGPDNPEGPLTKEAANEMSDSLKADRTKFFDGFTTNFFSANGVLKVSEEDRQKAIALCHQSDQTAALGCMEAFGTTDFRDDLKAINIPTLVLHGDADAIVPLEGSGSRTHKAIAGSELHILAGAPHGCNVSHDVEFNSRLIEFLRK
ncbi:alpha/beta hydrolase [Devosia sp.]|uniref:alpha/beta fold hydrolase n=1 Tax=Devosia sp. TaxID=1871048 RepID=UPI001B1A6427|nr:alpha/beta hydrolase [Devosia sp.]MBO9590826.1 alpha/beta hydrolase [Devosia sp.]